MNKETDLIWEFMNSKGQIVFTGNKSEVQHEARKSFFRRRIASSIKYRTFDRNTVSDETQKPEWKDIDDLFYIETGISKKEFLRSEKIGVLIVLLGLLVIIGGGLVLAVQFLLPNLIPHSGVSGSPARFGRLFGLLTGLLLGTTYVWKKYGPIAGILTLIGGVAAITKIL